MVEIKEKMISHDDSNGKFGENFAVIKTSEPLSLSDKMSERQINVLLEYEKGLDLLDRYDHHSLEKPIGSIPTYKLTFAECRKIIDSMKFSEDSELFGVEKGEGKLEGILNNVEQEVFGYDVYPTTEEKAAHLLYYLIKDHPFIDGCKRISATLFLEYLNRNNSLQNNGAKVISNETLTALVILIAESRADEKDMMIRLIMNLIN